MEKQTKDKIINLTKEIISSFREYEEGDHVFLIENEMEAFSFSEKLRKDALSTQGFFQKLKIG